MEMQIENTILISVSGVPYDFISERDGKNIKGTTYKAVLANAGEIYEMKCEESVLKDVGDRKNLEGTAIIKVQKSKSFKKQGEIELFLTQFNYK
jgi:hypothetical protein